MRALIAALLLAMVGPSLGAALDLDDGGGAGARGYQLPRHAACGGEAGYCPLSWG